MEYEKIDEEARYLKACENVKKIVNAIKNIKMKYYTNFAKISSEDNNYVVKLKSGKETKIYRIDMQSFFVTKIGTYDDKGNAKIEISYENFYERDGIYFPKKITISRPMERQNIWLTYSKEEFNKNKLTYHLKIPKSAKMIQW